ncbi:MAG: sensor domain-containing diguanylate cyclase [bacterium]|nr:sensor domain-containing diguanylate cyclase [bacterium]
MFGIQQMSVGLQIAVAVIGFMLFLCLISIIIWQQKKIREQKQLIKEREIEGERYRVATELANDVIFEYNVKTDIMHNSRKYKTVFGRNSITYNYTESFVNLRFVHPQDRTIFMEYCNALHIGKEKIEYEFRILNCREEYEWCHIRAKAICGSDNLPARVIGKIVNIDMQKRELEKLQFKAQRDPLTNTFNKGATEEVITEILTTSRPFDKHAFFVIDIDNFKHVNDTYGHLKGDHVLATLASRVNSLFREEDVVGRIGGDEFVVLMRDVTSIEQVINKATSMTEAFNRQFRKEDDSLEVSGSIGIAIYPVDGGAYKELLEHADHALYSVKNTGKNNFRLYSEISVINKDNIG